MVARPMSVPAARQFVEDTLTEWGCELFASDVGLCVDEMAANATLHSGCTYFQVELEKHIGSVVRAAVADTGVGSVDVLARQPGLSDAFRDDLTGEGLSGTGRGMLLVSALAHVWGIEELPAGKRVWTEFRPEPQPDQDGRRPRAARVSMRTEPAAATLDPEGWAPVHFRQCPPALLLAHDDNIAEYIRELQLIGDRLVEPSFRRLSQVLSEYVAQHAANWDPARIVAHQAVLDGKELVDIDVLATRDVRSSIRLLRHLVGEAEELSDQGSLMTLPAAEPVQRLRDWLQEEFIAQIEHDAEPITYPDWLAGVHR